LLIISELELLVALLAIDRLGWQDLLLGSAARMAEDWIIITLLQVMNLRTNWKVKLSRALSAVQLTMLELAAILVAIRATNGLGKALLYKDLLLARGEDESLPAVPAGNLLVAIQTAGLLLGAAR